MVTELGVAIALQKYNHYLKVGFQSDKVFFFSCDKVSMWMDWGTIAMEKDARALSPYLSHPQTADSIYPSPY